MKNWGWCKCNSPQFLVYSFFFLGKETERDFDFKKTRLLILTFLSSIRVILISLGDNRLKGCWMTFSGRQAELTNWTRSAYSPCILYQSSDINAILKALAAARKQHLTVIPHGAGHSYTDAALNTRGVVIDLTPMRRILSWDPARGIMGVEPGVTLREMVQVAGQDGWWPYAAPSTAEATVGGCTAMNVNGRNAWKWGPFGAQVLALEVLLASGDRCTLTPEGDAQEFHAFVGSMGLLGIITSITIQLQRIPSSYLSLRMRPARSLAEIFDLFAEQEPSSDYLEAWLDGFARGRQLGRGLVTSATFGESVDLRRSPNTMPGRFGRLETPLVGLAARLGRPALLPGVQIANRLIYARGRWRREAKEQSSLYAYTFWPPEAFAGYHALLPQGAETFQAFIPAGQARQVFEEVLRYSHGQGCLPVWCIIKKHQRDPFLLSYQVDGFSLELNYPRSQANAQGLKQVLEHMNAMVIEAGGRFYLAKDHFLTQVQYRRSIGEQSFDAFLELKQRFDPHMLLQSDLFRRIFQAT
jgi:decaprenylphospho-beta-D-ribofuranose 2-oxidase